MTFVPTITLRSTQWVTELLVFSFRIKGIEALDRPINLRITNVRADECPGVQIFQKLKIMENDYLVEQTYRSWQPGISVYSTNSSHRVDIVQFPSCYNLDFNLEVLKEIEDPEAEVEIWLLNGLQQLDCRNDKLQQFSRNCKATYTNPFSCKICNICDNLAMVEQEVSRKSDVRFQTECPSDCCKEPSRRPYKLQLRNLCIDTQQIEDLFAGTDLKQYLELQRRVHGVKGKDSLRIRLTIRDFMLPAQMRNKQDGAFDDKLRRFYNHFARVIGCYDVTLDFDVEGV